MDDVIDRPLISGMPTDVDMLDDTVAIDDEFSREAQVITHLGRQPDAEAEQSAYARPPRTGVQHRSPAGTDSEFAIQLPGAVGNERQRLVRLMICRRHRRKHDQRLDTGRSQISAALLISMDV